MGEAMWNANISTSSLVPIYHQFGGTIYAIHHGSAKAFTSNTWVEGLHCRTGGETHSAWYWYYPGSGIWIWSGTTEAFKDRYAAQQKYLGWHSSCEGSPGFECGGK